MYFYDRQLTGTETLQGGNEIVLRPSQRFHYPESLAFPFSSHLGQAMLSSYGRPDIAPPKGLKLLDHFHAPKQPQFSNLSKFFTSGVTKLVVGDMNPGFFDLSDNLMIDTTGSGLQTCLHKLITSQFQNYLSSKSATAPSKSDRLRVALVNLSGDRFTQPEFAGWGSPNAMYGASLPKILGVYAAHQVRMDLRQLATSQGITNGKDLKKAALANWNIKSDAPDLEQLFDILKWSGTPDTINFSTSIRDAFAIIDQNRGAATVISAVGFPYLGSLTWQSGLFHPTRGGLWLTTSFGKGTWSSNPVRGVSSANLTALSAATYFTLLAQERLVDDAGSNDIKNVLRHGCVTTLFPDSLKPGVVAAKCGIYPAKPPFYLHVSALIERGSVRYVVAVVTKTKGSELSKFTKVFEELDNLIVRNNQTPRPSC
jgi:hypothetical protein